MSCRGGQPERRAQTTPIGRVAATPDRVYALIDSALATASGRAPLTLAGALTGVPGWFRALQPLPSGLDDRIEAMTGYARWGEAWFWSGSRAELEALAGGNPTGTPGSTITANFSGRVKRMWRGGRTGRRVWMWKRTWLAWRMRSGPTLVPGPRAGCPG